MKMRSVLHRLHGWLILLTLTLPLSGCITDDQVTLRPDYAYPQNLHALCGETLNLRLQNRGNFESSSWSTRGRQNLLLSSQLLTEAPEVQYQIKTIYLQFEPGPSLTAIAFDEVGNKKTQHFGPEVLSCGEDGELLLQFPSTGYYFWASLGTKTRSLALWTNSEGGLVVQNQWRENQVGLVGGRVTGDAWAVFDRTSVEPSGLEPSSRKTAELVSVPENAGQNSRAGCVDLSGSYGAVAEVLHLDGSLETRHAAKQFFREELIGPHPLNQEAPVGDDLVLELNDVDNEIEIKLYQEDVLLGTRSIAAASVLCDEQRWRIRGDKKLASAWLLIIASGGVSWENLVMWRDAKGNLLVQGTYKARNALFLVPLLDTRSLFMTFPTRVESRVQP